MKRENISFYKKILDNMYDGVYFVDPDRTITYWNRGAEHISGYKSSEVIGTHCRDNILVHVSDKGTNLCRGLCPLAKTITDGKMREKELYLHHKEGHRVPVLIRTAPLRDSGNQIIGGIEIFSENSPRVAMRQRIEELQKMAMLDHLTKLANGHYIKMRLGAQLSETHRYGGSFGVLFVDIDHFKNVNDTYGHDIGDKVLKMVATTMLSDSRPFDILGRWGGEEFIAIIINTTEDQLHSIANRWRILVEQSKLSLNSVIIQVTISIGATMVQTDDTVDTLIARADKLMYRSKKSGRNRVSTRLEGI